MSARLITIAALLGTSGLMGAPPGFPLGVQQSASIGVAGPAAVDAHGAVYLAYNNSIEKLTSAADIVWQAALVATLSIATLTVDQSGNVYAISYSSASRGAAVISKVNANGTVNPASVTLGPGLGVRGVTVDGSGRLWVTGSTPLGVDHPLATTSSAYQRTLPNNTSLHGFVARLTADGTAIDYATYLAGSSYDIPSAVTVDESGSAFITGNTTSPDFPLTGGIVGGSGAQFLTRLKRDGSGLLYSVVVAQGGGNPAVAADASGDTSVIYEGPHGFNLAHFSPQGVLTFSKTGEGVSADLLSDPVVALDASGNTYVNGLSRGNHPVKNSIAPCGTAFLDVFSPGGDLLQSTWLPAPGAFLNQTAAITIGFNSTVYVLTSAFSQGREWLTALSPDSAAQPLPLACLADAAVYLVPGYGESIGFHRLVAPGITPGEIVSLFGEGLGPEEGVQPSPTLESGYPFQLSGVQVLFDGQPAPLLYVQDAQINAIAPWELTAGGTTKVCVSYNGVLTNCLMELVVQAAPAVFTIDGENAAALNQDGTINSAAHPAPSGTTVSIFATGLGPIAPAAKDGAIVVPPLPGEVLGVAAAIPGYAEGFILYGAIPFTVTYAGPAPFQVAGLSQINLLVPAPFSIPTIPAPDLNCFGAQCRLELSFVAVSLPLSNVTAPFMLYVVSTN
jgi:uncharacterized protein (TIGR03437 family)